MLWQTCDFSRIVSFCELTELMRLHERSFRHLRLLPLLLKMRLIPLKTRSGWFLATFNATELKAGSESHARSHRPQELPQPYRSGTQLTHTGHDCVRIHPRTRLSPAIGF